MTDTSQYSEESPADNYLRALIFTAAGYITVAAGIVGAILVNLPPVNPDTISTALKGELLANVSLIIVSAMAAIVILQALRLTIRYQFIDSGGWFSFFVTWLGLLVILVPSAAVYFTAQVGVCGGKALAAPAIQATPASEAPNAGLALLNIGPLQNLQIFDCAGPGATRFPSNP